MAVPRALQGENRFEMMLVEDKQSKHIVAFTILENNRNNGRYSTVIINL